MAHQDDANLKVIISRIQQRRGLKQDLPQPLRPGEIGFATDSKQVYIGADTDDAISATYNKTVSLENTLNASARTLSLANTQIIKFTVPHKRFPKGSGTFDGVSKSQSWLANADSSTSAFLINGNGNAINNYVFNNEVSSNDFITHNQTTRAFDADDVTLLINGVTQHGDSSGTGASVNAAYDFNFVSGNLSTSDHSLYLRVAPENSDDVTLTYYGNSHVIHSLSNTTIANGANVTGFHANMSIPSYRHLNNDLILVNPQVGTGFIGLETKHIDVVVEGAGVANISNVSCANVVFVKDPLEPSLITVDPANANNTIYSGVGNVTTAVDQANGNITFDTGQENIIFTTLANASAGYNGYVWTEGMDGSTAENYYYHQKLLPIAANSVGSSFTVSIPSNAFQTGRTVTSATVGSTVTLTGNIDGVLNGDYVVFEGVAGTHLVSNVNTGSGTFDVTTATLTSSQVYVNYGTVNTGAHVQVFSPKHGMPSANTVIVTDSSDSAIANANFSISGTAGRPSNITTNTFFIDSNTAVTGNVTGNIQPQLGDLVATDELTIKPAVLLDLSGTNTLNGIISTINGKNDWYRASLKPDTNDELYFYSDDQTQYRLFNDPQDNVDSLSKIGLSELKATRSANTVKAKLEEWLTRVIADEKVNIITNAFVNLKYKTDNSDVMALETWDVDVDTTNDEINFLSNDEAGNFAELVNKIYFKTNNPDTRGLVTVKTNIEMLTTQSLESGQSETFYSQPQQLTIGSNSNVLLSELGTDATAIDTLFVDYSIVGSALDVNDANITRYYNRVGTLQYNANPLSNNDGNGNINGTITLQDVSSTSGDYDANGNVYFSGNLTFGGAIDANGIVTITANNSIIPTTSNVVMKYVVRKWKSQ